MMVRASSWLDGDAGWSMQQADQALHVWGWLAVARVPGISLHRACAMVVYNVAATVFSTADCIRCVRQSLAHTSPVYGLAGIE